MWKRRRRSYDDWPNSWFRTAISRQALISQLVTALNNIFELLNFWPEKRHRLLVSILGLLNMIRNIWWRSSCEDCNWQRRRSMFCREKILFHKQGEEKKTREWGMTHYCSFTHHLYMVFKEPWDLDWPRKSQDRGQGVVVLTGALWRVRTKQEVSGQPPHFTNPSAPPCVTQAILPPRY